MFNFQQEIEDQLREIREQYGDEVLKEYLDQDYYDGEYCNPPLYRWSCKDAAAECQYYYCLLVLDMDQVHGIIKYNNISDPMPQNIDSNFDTLVSVYADIEVERMNHCNMLKQFAYETLVKEYGEMTEQELIEHVADEGDEEYIEQIYGNYPVQDLDGQYSLKRGESIVI